MLLIGAGCFGPSEPAFVDYTATLQSPNGAEGAAVIEVASDGLVAFESTADQLFTGPIGQPTRIVVILTTPGTIQFTVTVQGGTDPPTATVLDIADGNNTPRTALTGYSVTFERVGVE